MSLVTAAMSYLSRSALHSASVRAVLPEPTGPPIPTRSAGVSLMASWSRSAVIVSRTKNPRVLRLMARRQPREAGREIAELVVARRGGRIDHAGNAPPQLEQDALAVGLS